MYIRSDGGRAEAGFAGEAGDCVVRAIAIATQTPYLHVYADLQDAMREHVKHKRDKVSRAIKAYGITPRDGVYRAVYDAYLKKMGWVWTHTMEIGSGCQVRLRPEELPLGRLIVRVSQHLVAVIDGIPYDTHDPTRGGSRCVYGFWSQPQIWSTRHAS